MSKYTTEVRYICEVSAGLTESKGYDDVDSIIAKSIPKIFSFPFPIFDNSYKNVLCTKILRHYYTREIGFETAGLWKLKLETKLNEIMPYYNKLYESELIKFNPMYDVDLQTTHVGDKKSENVKDESRSGSTITSDKLTSEGTSKSDVASESVGTGKESGSEQNDKVNANNYSETFVGLKYDLYSDTPQGGLTGVNNEEYLTNARKVTDNNSKTGKSDTTEAGSNKYSKNDENTNISNENVRNSFDESRENSGSRIDDSSMSGSDKFNSTESYILHVTGKQAGASYSKMLKEFRDTFLNIDMEIIKSLSDLFMNIW